MAAFKYLKKAFSCFWWSGKDQSLQPRPEQFAAPLFVMAPPRSVHPRKGELLSPIHSVTAQALARPDTVLGADDIFAGLNEKQWIGSVMRRFN